MKPTRLAKLPMLLFALLASCGALPQIQIPADADHHVTSWRESVEAELDVIVFFAGEDWDRVRSEAVRNEFSWARRRVLEQLERYHGNPSSYFASQPPLIASTISFGRRIDLEILGHVLRGDNQIRFSQFFGTRYMWQPN